MIRIAFLFLILLASGKSYGQKIESLDVESLQDILHLSNDTVYVLNFWATWCSPCVAEIGYFENLHREHQEEKVKVILINLDFPNQITKRVIPFIEEKGLTAKILNMTELDYNKWIPLVDKSWSGAIPATLIFNKEKRQFLEKEVSQQELFSEVNKFLLN